MSILSTLPRVDFRPQEVSTDVIRDILAFCTPRELGVNTTMYDVGYQACKDDLVKRLAKTLAPDLLKSRAELLRDRLK